MNFPKVISRHKKVSNVRAAQENLYSYYESLALQYFLPQFFLQVRVLTTYTGMFALHSEVAMLASLYGHVCIVRHDNRKFDADTKTKRLTTPYIHCSVRPRTNKPWIPTTPFDLQNTQSLGYFVSPKNFQRDYQRVRHQVIIDSRMEDLDGTIVRRGCKEWIRWMEVERPYRTGMISTICS